MERSGKKRHRDRSNGIIRAQYNSHMRIARLSIEDKIHYAVETVDGYFRCQGSIEEGFSILGEELKGGKLEPPLVPETIYAIGLNYREHAIEMEKPIPEYPVVTMKSPSSLLEPGGVIELPRFLRSDSVDYECELGIIIGKVCKNVRPSEALDYVFGYTAANDISARDWQGIYSGGQWCKGKSFDTFCPIGPVLVTAEEIPDPDQLLLSTILNGETKQSSCTSDMIFSVSELVAFLSGSATLYPGTLILSGTPTGVGVARKPPRFLKEGDSIVVEVEKIGRLENSVKEEIVDGTGA